MKSPCFADKRFEAGIAEAAILQASASLENAKLAVLRAQSSILKSRNALQFLVGGPIPTNLIPTPAVSNITSQQIFSAGLPSELTLSPRCTASRIQPKSRWSQYRSGTSVLFPVYQLSK
ncbi:hypothetical protein [Psychrobacter sp. WY6]|uniref:hypothetical protein n=1 Tax=Psychrobacter sp. WY6 TaxID=2708350 RepID=UPI0020230E01|nr:hypothetical protein [Psychrobacter sp. WY6]